MKPGNTLLLFAALAALSGCDGPPEGFHKITNRTAYCTSVLYV